MSVLVPIALLTVVGLIALWPTGGGEISSVYQLGAYDTRTVSAVSLQPCRDYGGAQKECFVAQLEGGGFTEIPHYYTHSGIIIDPGDRMLVTSATEPDGQAGFVDFVRFTPLLVIAGIYLVAIVAVAGWKGLRAVFGLALSFATLYVFVVPSILAGHPGLLVALVGSMAMLFVAIYVAHGVSVRTSTALLSTIIGVAITCAVGWVALRWAKISGVTDEESIALSNAMGADVPLSGLVMAALVVSALGVLNDVAITQSSTVWEMTILAPRSSLRRIVRSAMKVGRDHIASTVYTITFAYMGSFMVLFATLHVYGVDLFYALNSSTMSGEVVATLSSSIGLVLTIPLATIIAGVLARSMIRSDELPEGHNH